MQGYDVPRRLLAYAIAALAGFVDATGYLAADGYFVSFMSGNTTRLGVDIGTRAANAFSAGLLVAGFVCGVTIGAVLAERCGGRRKTAIVGLCAALLAAGAAGQALGSDVAFLACSVLAMGAVNNAFRPDGQASVGLTYMTGALVRFGQGLAARLGGQPTPGWTYSLALWISLASGAIAGAVAVTSGARWAAWIAPGVALLLLAAAWWIEARGERARS